MAHFKFYLTQLRCSSQINCINYLRVHTEHLHTSKVCKIRVDLIYLVHMKIISQLSPICSSLAEWFLKIVLALRYEIAYLSCLIFQWTQECLHLWLVQSYNKNNLFKMLFCNSDAFALNNDCRHFNNNFPRWHLYSQATFISSEAVLSRSMTSV